MKQQVFRLVGGILPSIVLICLQGAWPATAEAACDANHPALGCCAGSVLRVCDVNGVQTDYPCNTKPANPVYGAYLCGHDNTTQSAMGCYTADLIDYTPATGNVWCPGFCLYGCTGDNCPGNCSADQTCNNGTCQTKACGHPGYFRQTYETYANQPGPADTTGLKSICTSMVNGWGFGVKENGTLFYWGDDSQTTGLFGNSNVTSITNAVEVACAQYHVTVRLTDGTLVAWGGPQYPTTGYQVSPPGNLTTAGANVVSVVANSLATGALRADGSIVLWGADYGGKFGLLNGKTGFKGIAAGGDQNFIGIKTDGTIIVAGTDGTQANNTFLPAPVGLTGVIRAGLTGQTAIALKQDGTVVTWGSINQVPPADLKPCIDVTVGYYGATTAVLALQVDGKVRAWGWSSPTSGGGGLQGVLRTETASAIAALSGVIRLDPHGGGVIYCTGNCGAVSPEGCCDGDKVHRCSPFGVDVVSTCATGTCGWQSSASDFECSTPGTPAPGGAPLQTCMCIPSCKNTDGTTKQCGSDGCGGTCDKGSCDDGDPCTINDKCSGEACVGGGAFSCDDKNVCTDDSCSTVSGAASCTNTPNTVPCDDVNACTSGDTCAAGTCVGGAAVDCNDGNVCTDDSCAPASGCAHLANAATCSDGSVCTLGDSCSNSACQSGTSALDCNDGNPCTVDSCDTTLGCQHVDADSGTVCDDNSNCTANDHCAPGGKCTGTSNVNCDDGNPCTSDNCIDPNTCAPHVAILEGNACSDGNACHVGGKCASGVCTGLTAQNCDDGNPCTDDGCDTKTGCTHGNNGAACSDNNTCTAGDLCSGGNCVSGSALNCDDKNPCTDDSCDKALGCQHVANTATCDDKSVCTQTDSCVAGVCVGGNLQNCDDGQICTNDNCNALLGCQHAGNSAPCNDGNACTKGDACWQGTCVGGATPSCNDGNSCTTDSCDAQKGCVYTANTTPCDDGNPCTVGDTCSLGSCKSGGGALTCDDGKLCTTDSCVAGKGCVFGNNNLACDDGEVCTVKDTCSGGVCTGSPKPCDDGNPCTDDSCALGTGCVHKENTAPCSDGNVCTDDICVPGKGCVGTPNQVACSDGNPCTLSDMCAGGACVGGKPNPCDDGNPCTGDHCSATGAGASGCWHSGWDMANQSCDDGDPCNGPDRCNGSGGCQKSSYAYCGSGSSCTVVNGAPVCKCPTNYVPVVAEYNFHWCCHPDCSYKSCGPDGCGGQCPNLCAADEICNADWGYQCAPAVACYGKAPTGTFCCDGDKLNRCFAPKSLYTTDCAAQGQHCGWSTADYTYACTDEGAPEPTGKYPFKCPKAGTCTPNCAGKNCGSDGCGGTCGACTGTNVCDFKAGQCLNPCDGVAPTAGCLQGVLNGQEVLATCPNIHGKTADIQQSVCAAGQAIGWDQWQKRFLCGGTDSAPADKTKACPAQACSCGLGVLAHNCGDNGCGGSCGTCTNPDVCFKSDCCTPACSGKACGDDGCGGTCGTCPSGQTCLANGNCAVPECAGMANPAGSCFNVPNQANTVEYCTDNAKVSVNCTALGALTCLNGNRATCWFPDYGMRLSDAGYGYVSFDATHCGTRPADKRCAKINAVCDCGPGCVAEGNCCDDYDATCVAPSSHAACGDKTCSAALGETCETCSQDCGACKDATAPGGPWWLPYPAYVESPGAPEVHAAHAIRPLDDVRPQVPPLPLAGLLAYLPGVDAAQTAPGTRVVNAALKSGGAVAAVSDGVQGQAVSLVDAQGQNRGGIVQMVPDQLLPHSASYARHQAGGLTIAGWVRTPTNASDKPNLLGAARAASSTGKTTCTWSRPQEAAAPISCGGGTIVAIQAYYGEVKAARFPPYTDGNANVASDSCDILPQLGPTYRCQDAAVQALAEKSCLGKSSCWVDPWKEALDPCSAAPYKPMKSTLLLRAVCDTGPTNAAVTLAVDAAADGHHLRLAGPGLPPLVSQSEFPTGQWAHVALLYAPHGASTNGSVTLYVDGKPQATAEGYTFPKFYEWDWGLGQVDGVDKTWNGYLDPGINAKAPNFAGRFDLDDAVLYDRALTPAELSTLVSKPNIATLRVWPAIDAARVVQYGLWASGGTPTATSVTVAQLVDPATGKGLAADFQAISVAGGQFAAPAEGSDLNNLSNFAWAGWIRVAALGASTTLLDLSQGTTHRIKIATDSTCNGGGLRADLASGKSVTTSNCDHVLTANTWAFVGYIQSGGTGTLYLDGAKLGSASVTGSLFDSAISGARTFSAGTGVDLGWSALYGRALSNDELDAQRSQGPAVWLDGALYVPSGATSAKPRDFAAFLNTGMTAPTGGAQAFTGAWAAQTSAGTLKNGFIVVPGSGRFHAGLYNGKINAGTDAYTYVGTVNVANPGGGTLPLLRRTDGVFVAERYRLICTPSSDQSALNCHVDIASDFTFSKVAQHQTTSSDTFALKSTAKSLSIRLALAFDGQFATGAVSVIATDGQTPVTLQLGANATTDSQSRTLNFTQLGTTTESTSAFLVSAQAKGLILDAASGTDGNTLVDTRLYTRVLSDAELRIAATSGCTAEACGAENRSCLAAGTTGGSNAMANATGLASCGGCEGTASEVAGTCRPKVGFRAACSYGDDCVSGLCVHGHCRAASADSACTQGCLALGHTCEAKASGFECSAQCATDFNGTQTGTDPISGEWGYTACTWTPPHDTADTCTSGQDCASAVCSAHTTTHYGVTNTDTKLTTPVYANNASYAMASQATGPLETCTSANQCAQAAPTSSTDNVCAAATTQSCDALLMSSRLVHATAWDGTAKDAYVCEGCLKDTYQGDAGDPKNGQPLYVQSWSMLSPDACVTIYKNYFDLLSGGVISVGSTNYHANVDGWADQTLVADMGDILAYPPSIARLRKLLLKDPDAAGTVTPEVLSQLEQAGVGRSLLDPNYKTWMYEQLFWPTGGTGNAWRPEQLRLGACARATYDFTNDEGWAGGHGQSPFFDHDNNHPVCVENKFPNGTSCPPSGTKKTYTRANAGLFCASGFCAADNKVCEDGFQAYEEDHGSARNDGNSGGNGNDLGAIALIQDNGSTFRFDRVDETTVTLEDTTTDHRHIFLEGHSKNSVNIFGFAADVLDLSVTIVEVPGAADEKDKADVAKEFLICGVQPPSLPELPKASCGAAEFKDGEYTAPTCKMDKAPIGVSASHTTKKKSKNGTEKAAETAIEITGGDVVPTITYHVPLPLEECPEKLEGFKAVFGRVCFAKETAVGPVPFRVEAEISPEATVEFGVELDSETFEPAAKIKPAVALSLEVKGGVGGEVGPVEIFAGLKAAITIIEVALPISFGFSFEQLTDDNDSEIQDLWVVAKVIKTEFEITFLQIALSVFFEVGVGPFKLELEYGFFDWDGISLSWELGQLLAEEYKVDFQWDSYATTTASSHGGTP